MIVAGIMGISLLLIIIGLLSTNEDTGALLILIGIVGISLGVVIDGFERSDKLNDLYGRKTTISALYSTNSK